MKVQYYEKNLDPQQLVSSEEESAKRFVNSERQTDYSLVPQPSAVYHLAFTFFRYALCAML